MANRKKENTELLEQLVDRLAPRNAASLKVGIRNISSYTIGIRADGDEPELQLSPAHPGVDNTGSGTAVVSWTRWKKLRQDPKLVGKGLLMRDDSILSGMDSQAPADGPHDIHPDFERNAILDPFQWIESKTEEELTAAISQLTSEPSVRRLQAAIDYKIFKWGEEHCPDAKDRAKQAIRALPALYKKADEELSDRLDALNPGSKTRHEETELKASVFH